ncbi:uncharacterized protein LOC131676447 isoform X2 [Topomyia yanbarensis]|uniref:uncharacterized protein LOC131676447 isoform X2 n=1 Tax=Topomyia yanbarensis TaxID=2498891 RepID=UPI00273C9119|nr:uncharacterized protein LOC131676447 isoform X2 [Topomyia yanbarensis]
MGKKEFTFLVRQRCTEIDCWSLKDFFLRTSITLVDELFTVRNLPESDHMEASKLLSVIYKATAPLHSRFRIGSLKQMTIPSSISFLTECHRFRLQRTRAAQFVEFFSTGVDDVVYAGSATGTACLPAAAYVAAGKYAAGRKYTAGSASIPKLPHGT